MNQVEVHAIRFVSLLFFLAMQNSNHEKYLETAARMRNKDRPPKGWLCLSYGKMGRLVRQNNGDVGSMVNDVIV